MLICLVQHNNSPASGQANPSALRKETRLKVPDLNYCETLFIYLWHKSAYACFVKVCLIKKKKKCYVRFRQTRCQKKQPSISTLTNLNVHFKWNISEKLLPFQWVTCEFRNWMILWLCEPDSNRQLTNECTICINLCNWLTKNYSFIKVKKFVVLCRAHRL